MALVKDGVGLPLSGACKENKGNKSVPAAIQATVKRWKTMMRGKGGRTKAKKAAACPFPMLDG